MKIKVECTLEVDPKVIKQLMQEKLLADSNETIRYFVRSHVISAGVGTLSDALYDANLEDAIDVIKTNVLGE
tara:strand:+ start:606 stop:821 length:216 start_codon:yes stop_codon:yes gene_type:complete